MNTQWSQAQNPQNLSPFADFYHGALFLVHGMRLLLHRELRLFVLLPFLLNALFIAGLVWLIWYYLHSWVLELPNWLTWLGDWILAILKFVIGLFLLTSGVIGYFFLFQIVAAPFHSLLSERVLEIHQYLPAHQSWWALPKVIVRAGGREVRKWCYFIVVSLMIFFVSLLPVINLMAPLLWFVWAVWVLSVEYTDYAADACGVRFRALRKQLRQKKWMTIGFGCATVMALMIPLVNLIILPTAVIGGTLLWMSFNPDRRH